MADTGLAVAKRGAAANTSGKRVNELCQNCVKQGFAVMPVISGVMSNFEAPIFPISPSFSLAPFGEKMQIDALKKGLSAQDLKEHWYFMRSLRAGYLYVLKPDKDWDAYLVDSSGLLRKIAASSMPSSPTEVEPLDKLGVCNRVEHSNLALQFFVLDPVKTPEVWIAYSRYKWTDKVRNDHAANVDGVRDLRMTRLDVVSAAEGKLGGYTGSPVPHGMKMTSSIGDYVADYSSAATRTLINKSQCEPLYARGDISGRPPVLPQSMGAELAQKMATVSEKTTAKTGAVILIHDVVGVAMQLNHYRNKIAAEAADVSGMGDETRSRKRVIAEIIEGIRANAEKNPGPWWAENYGPDRYLKHINETDWITAKQNSARFNALLEHVKRISADYVVVKESSAWKQVHRGDFDGDDHTSSLNCEDMVASCVAGSGQTKIERDLVWYPVLELESNDPNNWLARALCGVHKPFLDYLGGAPSDQDEAYDTVKEAGELSSSLTGKGLTQINEFRAVIRNKRAVNLATAAIIETSAGILFNLHRDNPKAYRKLVRKVAFALITRDDVIPRAVVVKGTWSKITQKIMAIATGEPRVSARAPLSTVPSMDRGAYLATKGNLGAKGWGLSQALDGAIVLDLPDSKAGTAETVAWVVSKLEAGEKLDKSLVRTMKLSELNLMSSSAAGAENPFLSNHAGRLGNKVDIGLTSGALFFQVNVFVSALNDYRRKENPTGADKADLTAGITVAVLAGIGAGLELTLAVQSLRGAEVVAKGVILRRAATLGLMAGVIEGVYAIGKGTSKAADGDVDSGLWTMGSGVALVIGSAASYGAFTGSVLGLGASLGPVGWALLVIGFLGLALYCAWQAFATDDENLLPVEYWLDNGIFGKGKHRTGSIAKSSPYYSTSTQSVLAFAKLEDEIYGLQRVTLVAQGRFGEMSDRRGYSLHFSYNVALPRYAKGSRLELDFTAVYKGKRIQVGGITCKDGSEKLIRSNISKKFTGMREEPVIQIDKDSGVMELKGRFSTLQEEPLVEKALEWVFNTDTNPDAQYADAMELRGSYWPDKINLPGLVTTFEYPPKK
jgi:hypothetical protein